MLERRSFLSGLVSLSLIGGGVTLIGRPSVRVPLADVAGAPLLDDPRQRARYAWEALSAAMREMTVGTDGWHVNGGQRTRSLPRLPAGESWFSMRVVHHVPLGGDFPGEFTERHLEINLR